VFRDVFQSEFSRIDQKWLEVMAMHGDTEARVALAMQDFLRLE
jgi:hypothetical protein